MTVVSTCNTRSLSDNKKVAAYLFVEPAFSWEVESLLKRLPSSFGVKQAGFALVERPLLGFRLAL